ncbi:MAG: hypothetical protein ABIO30_10400 [Thermomonas sp.]
MSELESPHQLSRHTTPTWEVELLISGVAVFAMLQLPGLLDDVLLRLLPRFESEWREPLKLMYMYVKSTAVILAGTFSLHLLLRAQWIALVGMHSVFPDGVRWERLRMGPVQRAMESAHRQDAATMIDRADNRATTVFAVGVMMASLLLSVSLLIAVMFGIGITLLSIVDLHPGAANVFAVCALVAAVPILAITIIDRKYGSRLRPDGIATRAMTRLFRVYRVLGLGRGNNALGLLASHGGERRTVLTMMVVFLPVVLGVMVGVKLLQSPGDIGNYAAFPAPLPVSGRRLDAAHYDAWRDLVHDPAVPYLDNVVAIGAYLRLVVPFRPGEDDIALRRECAEAQQASDPVAILDCEARVHAVTLDGKTLPVVRYDAGSDARTDRPALVAMIDIRALAPGRHELRVRRAAPDPGDDVYVIPFWR